MGDALPLLVVGLFLGMRHATDADHVVAITTITSRERTLRGAAMIGAVWGVGHTATVLLVGSAIAVFGLVVPRRVGLSMEMSVAAMLIVLGALNLRGALRHVQVAARGGGLRRHLRPLMIGVVHGLAGSAAVSLLVVSTIRSRSGALLYLGVFGVGTILGMTLLTVAMATPLAAATRSLGGVHRTMARVTGVISICVGLVVAYRVGIVDGLLIGAPAVSHQ